MSRLIKTDGRPLRAAGIPNAVDVDLDSWSLLSTSVMPLVRMAVHMRLHQLVAGSECGRPWLVRPSCGIVSRLSVAYETPWPL